MFYFVKNFNHPYSNWILENLDHYNFKDILLDEICQELRNGSPKDELPENLKAKLEKLSRAERKELVSRVKDGIPVLFLACKKGNLEVVKFLIETCDADPEQIGIYEVLDENTTHRVSLLYKSFCIMIINNRKQSFIIDLLLTGNTAMGGRSVW